MNGSQVGEGSRSQRQQEVHVTSRDAMLFKQHRVCGASVETAATQVDCFALLNCVVCKPSE